MPAILTKRVYEPAAAADGFRILVDRVWPRGLTKDAAAADLWLKDIAPSTALRKWFQHDPGKWVAFSKAYLEELRDEPALQLLKQYTEQHSTLTLLYGARDEAHNHALVLQELLQKAGSRKK
jgi:uncharacterized protein YeaO (DUF488 family)